VQGEDFSPLSKGGLGGRVSARRQFEILDFYFSICNLPALRSLSKPE
jgi:hypothetical protein